MAAATSLPLDAVIAVLLEWSLCSDVAKARGMREEDLAARARLALGEARLPPTVEFRVWDRQLAGHGPFPTGDELPEVCLPERLRVRLPRTARLSRQISVESIEAAVLCDRAAAQTGMTMEVWVLRQLLPV
jgi:hypothetical protein